MTVGIAHAILLAGAVFVTGFYLVARDDRDGPLSGVTLMLVGAALALVAVSRFAGSRLDPLSGQEFAVGIALLSPALVFFARAFRAEDASP